MPRRLRNTLVGDLNGTSETPSALLSLDPDSDSGKRQSLVGSGVSQHGAVSMNS